MPPTRAVDRDGITSADVRIATAVGRRTTAVGRNPTAALRQPHATFSFHPDVVGLPAISAASS